MSSSTNSSPLSQKTSHFQQKYKTQKCRYWYERGFCPFNQMCAFAHTQHELRDKHALNQHYKTKICNNFKIYGFCKYGDRCQFLHVQEAPLVYNRIIEVAESFPDHKIRKLSMATEQGYEKKHQKQLSILQSYGLDVLWIKKGSRSQRWRSFLIEGVDPYQFQRDELLDFSQEFPDYNFLRKPRLGSL